MDTTTTTTPETPATPEPISVDYINNTGGGFMAPVTVPSGTTLKTFFTEKMGTYADPADYLILVNGKNARGGYALQAGDGVSISPTGVKGA